MSTFIPTREQEMALGQPAPLLVLAGAGTGKTTVLTRRIAGTIASGAARPDQVLALTFTDKAAAEMAERLGEVLDENGSGEVAREATVGTFHSFGRIVIAENVLRLGFDRAPAVISNPAAWQLLAALFDELSFDAIEVSTGLPGAVFGHLLHAFSQCRDHLVGPEDLERHADGLDPQAFPPALAEYLERRRGELREVAAAYRRYEAAKREKCLVDFGDLLYLPVRLLLEHPDLRAAYRRRFRFIFVDEYQDTNHAQRELLLQLLDPAQPAIMVIGDDDQAIYRWRGAVVQNILRFHKEGIFAPDQVKRVPMTLNRRSFPPILDLANLAIAPVQQRHAKELRYHEEKAKERAIVGHYLAESDQEEARWIAAKIRELEPAARGLAGKKVGFGAFVVLCRKRRLFEPIGQALERAGIPYELIGGTGFYGRWEIRDILSYLRVLVDPADDLAAARILRSRRWRLAGRELFHLAQWVGRQNGDRGRSGEGRPTPARLHLLDAVLQHEGVKGLSEEAVARLAALREELREHAAACQRLALGDFVTRVVERSGYRRELQARTGFDARVALLNLDKLEEMARQFGEGIEGASLAGFVEYVGYALESGEEEGEVRPIDEETDTVKVMTIHQAKGLEFPIVFIPGVAERIFPNKARDETDKWYELPWELRGDREHLPKIDLRAVQSSGELKRALDARKAAEQELQLDEERRLFYVAITRAQRQLYFTRAHWYGPAVKPRAGSEFWDIVVASGLSEDLGEAECPGENPNLVAPPGAIESEGEREPGESPNLEGLLLPGNDPGEWVETTARREGCDWTAVRAEVDAQLEWLGALRAPDGGLPRVDVSCSGLILYLDCPRHYRYRYVDRLPSPPSTSARTGQEVHRLIEELSRPPEQPLAGVPKDRAPDEEDISAEEDRLEDLVAAAKAHAGAEPSGQGRVVDLVARFRESVYGGRPATFVEVPFRLPLRAGSLRGRMDRLDALPEGNWEVVDFKSGTSSPEAAAIYRRQLALYSLAVHEVWQVPAHLIAAHLFFLRDGADLPFTFGEADLDRLRTEAEGALLSIARGEFPATAHSQLCAGCCYGHLCAVLAGSPVS